MAEYTEHYNLEKPGYDDARDIGVINGNMDTIDDELYKRKGVQTAVVDPTASGTSVTFIKTIMQNTQGVITPTKATVPTLVGATASANGSAGMAPQPLKADKDKFLKGDGSWAEPQNTTYSEATSSAYGLIKIGYTESGKNYPVKLSSGKAYVNVPWTDTDTNTWRPVAVNGTTKLSADGGTTMDLVAGDNMTVTHSSGGHITFAADLSSCAKKSGSQSISGVTSFTNTTASTSTSTGAVKISGGLGVAKNIYGNKVYNAVWNDYAEFRRGCTEKGGYCVVECPDGVMRKSHKRLQPGARLTSDTYGSCMGYSSEARTPVAVAGRVLAYPCGDRGKFSLGAAVCSGPDGTVSVMSRREIRKYPERIVGTVSEIPDYEEWNAGTEEHPETVKVDGRIWIYVR